MGRASIQACLAPQPKRADRAQASQRHARRMRRSGVGIKATALSGGRLCPGRRFAATGAGAAIRGSLAEWRLPATSNRRTVGRPLAEGSLPTTGNGRTVRRPVAEGRLAAAGDSVSIRRFFTEWRVPAAGDGRTVRRPVAEGCLPAAGDSMSIRRFFAEWRASAAGNRRSVRRLRAKRCKAAARDRLAICRRLAIRCFTPASNGPPVDRHLADALIGAPVFLGRAFLRARIQLCASAQRRGHRKRQREKNVESMHKALSYF